MPPSPYSTAQTDGAGHGLRSPLCHPERRSKHGASPPKQSLHPGHQFQREEWLDEVVIAAQRQSGDPVIGALLGGDDDDGQLGTGFPQNGADTQPVRSRHHNVQHHQVGQMLPAGREQRVPSGKGLYPEAFLREKSGDELSDIFSSLAT